ncbi:hypothetical protein K9N68_07585 [Kovacikia minuta CCNUW1]|uniref:hypothetical protein n=1 Tax=Kovacikia minuta TaxID=2931930 RepID=UPI001CCEE290|nr:hypothetical protein [Kovacikia minuta]UBF27766.1 hypothetical protein K9N68_07585 [Kovacikia minuta CCNUW1]
MFFRLILLLAIVGGFVLFTWSNLQPVALVFLGIQMPAFPLAFWVLGAIAAGTLTTFVISILFNLSHYVGGRAVRSQFRRAARSSSRFQEGTGDRIPTEPKTPFSTQATTPKEDDTAWKNWEGYEDPVDRPRTKQQSVTQNQSVDDWETEIAEDWEDAAPGRSVTDTPRDSLRDRTEPANRDRTDYEVAQEPKTSSRSGSVYSYGYRDPGSSGVGKAEPVVDKPVVDADYRVIVPPYRSLDEEPVTPAPEPVEEENADDWFEDDSNDEVEGKKGR